MKLLKFRYAVLGFIVGLASMVGAHLIEPARAAVQNQSNVTTGVFIDLVNNVAYVDVAFTDSDDGKPIGINRYTMKATGPITDLKGRIVAGSTPANIVTDIGTLKTDLLAAIATGVAGGVVKP